MLPEDPVLLLSFVNTQLRDNCRDLDDFCALYGADRGELEKKLADIDYEYDSTHNQFV